MDFVAYAINALVHHKISMVVKAYVTGTSLRLEFEFPESAPAVVTTRSYSRTFIIEFLAVRGKYLSSRKSEN